ncbi:MAG: hypothetical protein O2955_00370 [Planctomycetota bacterium]|nr:hypothetical protein [Planctomycetota bacterium]MDA1210935.1 hypothetical protein [Planctomycetota bacterium]
MARKVTSRKELRKQAEAAEARDGDDKGGVKKKKKVAVRKKVVRAKRTKEKTPARMRRIWAIYSGTMKEEARFSYEQHAEAEQKMEELRGKSKKMYFILPLSEPITEPLPVAADAE